MNLGMISYVASDFSIDLTITISSRRWLRLEYPKVGILNIRGVNLPTIPYVLLIIPQLPKRLSMLQ